MASQLARENTRYYVGRRDLDEQSEVVVHFVDYNRLFMTEESFTRTEGFNEARTANIIAARLNQIEDEAAKDLGALKKFHYFTYKKDDQVMTLGNYEAPTEEEEEEAPADEEASDNPEGTEEGA